MNRFNPLPSRPSRLRAVAAFCLASTGLLAGCSAMPEKNIHTAIEIDAPRSVVWDILADNRAYPLWNPYHVQVGGTLREGQALDVVIHKPNGETVHIEPRVLRIRPETELTWGGGIKGVFFGEHVFELSSVDERTTRLVHKERFSGFAIPFASLEAIEEGYRRMNRALKTRAESTALAGTPSGALNPQADGVPCSPASTMSKPASKRTPCVAEGRKRASTRGRCASGMRRNRKSPSLRASPAMYIWVTKGSLAQVYTAMWMWGVRPG